MKKKSAIAIVATAIGMSLLALLSGCAPTNISSLMHEVSGDTNSFHISVSSVWGTVDVKRNMPEK
jgi:hypothetical protein